jgi:hypothetical protein
MFVWSRTIRDDELVLWQLIHVIEDFRGWNQFGARKVTGVEQRFVADVNNKDFVFLNQSLKFDNSDSSSTIGIRGGRIVRVSTGLLDFRNFISSGATGGKNNRTQKY